MLVFMSVESVAILKLGLVERHRFETWPLTSPILLANTVVVRSLILSDSSLYYGDGQRKRTN